MGCTAITCSSLEQWLYRMTRALGQCPGEPCAGKDSDPLAGVSHAEGNAFHDAVRFLTPSHPVSDFCEHWNLLMALEPSLPPLQRCSKWPRTTHDREGKREGEVAGHLL